MAIPLTGSAPVPTGKPPTDLRLVRGVVFLYVALWIFEGALRKWIVPSLANPLLVVRDPVLLGLYALALAKGVFPRSAFIPWIAGLGVLATFLSLSATNAPMFITLYGLRADYLHLPLIFLLPNVLGRGDLRWLGKWWLVIAAGMAVLVLLQFRSGAGAFLNRGAGENTVMLDSAFGHIRPSGTFSYTNGLTGFTTVTVAFFLQHLLEKRVYPRLVWLAATPAVLILLTLSGSRTAAATIALVLAGVGVVCTNVTSLPEVGGEAALYFGPDDPGTAAEHLRVLLTDPAARAARVDAGRRQAASLTWERHYERLQAIYCGEEKPPSARPPAER